MTHKCSVDFAARTGVARKAAVSRVELAFAESCLADSCSSRGSGARSARLPAVACASAPADASAAAKFTEDVDFLQSRVAGRHPRRPTNPLPVQRRHGQHRRQNRRRHRLRSALQRRCRPRCRIQVHQFAARCGRGGCCNLPASKRNSDKGARRLRAPGRFALREPPRQLQPCGCNSGSAVCSGRRRKCGARAFARFLLLRRPGALAVARLYCNSVRSRSSCRQSRCRLYSSHRGSICRTGTRVLLRAAHAQLRIVRRHALGVSA